MSIYIYIYVHIHYQVLKSSMKNHKEVCRASEFQFPTLPKFATDHSTFMCRDSEFVLYAFASECIYVLTPYISAARIPISHIAKFCKRSQSISV